MRPDAAQSSDIKTPLSTINDSQTNSSSAPNHPAISSLEHVGDSPDGRWPKAELPPNSHSNDSEICEENTAGNRSPEDIPITKVTVIFLQGRKG